MAINTNTGLVTWTPNVSQRTSTDSNVIDIPSSGTPIRYTTDQFITVLKKTILQ